MPGAVRWHASPNYGDRRNGLTPRLIVLHFTAMDGHEAALKRLCDPKAEVSAHYLISQRGVIFQLVEEQMRAWHAGEGQWAGQGDVNSRSIGIELDNTGASPFAEPMMAALEALMPDIMARWSIPAHGVIGHSDMAPDRKFDPGPRFDWRRLARAGLSVWPEADATDIDFSQAAARFGYDLSYSEDAVLHAFRQRFRPIYAHLSGPADHIDRAMAANLARRFGIDRAEEPA